MKRKISDGKWKEVIIKRVSLFCCLTVLTYTANMCHELMTYLLLHEEKKTHTVRRDVFIPSIGMEGYLSFKRQFINCSCYLVLKY
jgi:hypothetical protein